MGPGRMAHPAGSRVLRQRMWILTSAAACRSTVGGLYLDAVERAVGSKQRRGWGGCAEPRSSANSGAATAVCRSLIAHQKGLPLTQKAERVEEGCHRQQRRQGQQDACKGGGCTQSKSRAGCTRRRRYVVTYHAPRFLQGPGLPFFGRSLAAGFDGPGCGPRRRRVMM